MSLTKASFSMIQGAVVSVLDYGAIDGAANNTTAIQAAVNSRTDGYTIWFPEGVWNFTEVTIADKTNLTLTGPGIINGQFTVHNVTNDNDVQSNIVFKDLSFNRGRPDGGTKAIKLVKVAALKISGCFFKGVEKCISIEGVVGITQSVQRVSITDCSTGLADASLYSAAEKIAPYVYQTKGFPYYFYYCASVGGVFSAGDVTMTGCNPCFVSVTHVYTIGQDGLVLTGNTFFSTSYSYQSPIKENVIYADRTIFANITNNEIFEAGYEGIYLDAVSNATVVGNNIIWPGQRDANRGAGIVINRITDDPVTASQITGNLIRIPTSDGIKVGGSCQFVSCVGNKIITPGNNAFYYGTNPITTAYGIRTQPSGWQNAYFSNVTMQGYNLIVKSYDTTYGDYRLAGPFQNDNIVLSGNGAKADSYAVGTITSNTIDIDGAQSVLINTLGGTINNITGGNSGYTTTFYVSSNAITLQASGTIVLGTAATLVVPVGGNVTLLQKGNVWQLLSSAL
jgi:parallel beta-helix repeat protein